MEQQTKPRKNKLVALIEDDPHTAQMYGERLDIEGYDVIWAKNGLDGIDLVLGAKPDLVITDLLMPSRGGLGLLRVIRSLPYLDHLPIIILTNYPKSKFVDDANRYGISAFIAKSQTLPKDLVKAVSEALSQAKPHVDRPAILSSLLDEEKAIEQALAHE